MSNQIKVTVWNEYRHEQENSNIRKIYPHGIHGAIAGHLQGLSDLQVRTATLREPEHGLTDEVLADTDVLIWWGHMAHEEVSDVVVERVHRRILDGMGLIALHSSHFSKIFKKLMGTSCELRWREIGERERIWVVEPGHPIVRGLKSFIEVEATEMYGEHFDVPEPNTLVFISWFQGGEVFRSGICYYRGRGKIFYFRPGHESYPIFHQPEILQVIENAVRWAVPVDGPKTGLVNARPLEKMVG